ncbi:MAG: L,D-transpeptidase family protein [Polyangiaceae bacterium]|jgi:hypothetical protein|nr:L,D-transpeptidase family protein [Polyangiaceae bacterium]
MAPFALACSHAEPSNPADGVPPVARRRSVVAAAAASAASRFPARAARIPRPGAIGIPDDALQAVVVTTDTWKSHAGLLERFVRAEIGGAWSPAPLARADVVLGRYGLAWGRGLHPDRLDGPVKSEGDQRSPAGVFDLGEARGYAKEPPAGTTWPFSHSGAHYRCVDNPRSDAYNTFIPTRGQPLPRSVGVASRETVFELMVFVLHNTSPVQRGAGSCVFLHVWANPGTPTQGCIGMDRANLRDLLSWLNLEHRPVLVQLPREERRRRAADWRLP